MLRVKTNSIVVLQSTDTVSLISPDVQFGSVLDGEPGHTMHQKEERCLTHHTHPSLVLQFSVSCSLQLVSFSVLSGPPSVSQSRTNLDGETRQTNW